MEACNEKFVNGVWVLEPTFRHVDLSSLQLLFLAVVCMCFVPSPPVQAKQEERVHPSSRNL